MKIFEEITSGKLDHKTWEKRFVHKAGHMIYTEISLTAVRKKDGKVDYLLTTIKDITELKDSTVALSESEEKLNALFKAMTDLVALYEVVKNKKDEIVNFKLIDCNNAFKDNINLGKNGMGKLITEFTQIGQPEHLNIYKKVAKSGKAQKFTIHFKSENQYFMTSVVSPKKGQLAVMAKNITDLKYAQEELEHHKNNLQKLVEERTKELNSANHHLAKANKTLVNRKNKLEAALDQLKATQVQLIQSEKMASLGVLAAGVAHEINNPLNFIHGSVRLLELYIDDNLKGHKEKLTPILYGAKEGIKRTSNIVKSLNLYSRRDKSKNRKCDIHKVIDNCLIMLNNQIKNRIEIKKLYTHVNFNLSANEGKMHQIMLNLLANAVEAIAEKGTITILTKIRAQKLAVTVTDTGKGISSENISKIMDPFFTTKPPGKGTGLGLYLTNRLIAEHNGQLSVASTPGTGSSIKVLLPISK